MATKAKTKATETVDPKEMSKKELDLKRKEISQYYESNIPHLKIQLEYEELLRDIEKTRAERLQAQMFVAQTMAGPPENEEEAPSSPADTQTIDPAKMSGERAAEEIKRQLKRTS